MSFKGKLGIILVILGFCSIPLVRLGGGEILLISLFLIVFGTSRIIRDNGGQDRIKNVFGRRGRATIGGMDKDAVSRIDPLLPVRVLKLAESHSGVLTVSVVAMALNVGLDECQIALDDLVHKGAATADVDLSTGVSTYRFPEFLPHTINGAEPL